MGLGGGIVAGFVALTYAYAYLAMHPARKHLTSSPENLGFDFEDISFRTFDGLLLKGWLIPTTIPKPVGIIILCHGYTTNRQEMLPYAVWLRAAGFTTLSFDFRSMGESEGNMSSVGYHETEDLRAAVDYLASTPELSGLPIGVLGISLGGAVAIMTAARDSRICAVVADAPYASLHDAIGDRSRLFLGPLGPAGALMVRWWTRKWLPVAHRKVAPHEEIAAIAPRAVMLIQGTWDLTAPWRKSRAMYEKAGEPKSLWLLPRSLHARCLRDQPEEYARRVIAFFSDNLNSGV